MPDHLYMVLAPKCDADGLVSVSEIMQAIKGVSAHRINRARQEREGLGGKESFDRARRREESSGDKVAYILGNGSERGSQ